MKRIKIDGGDENKDTTTTKPERSEMDQPTLNFSLSDPLPCSNIGTGSSFKMTDILCRVVSKFDFDPSSSSSNMLELIQLVPHPLVKQITQKCMNHGKVNLLLRMIGETDDYIAKEMKNLTTRKWKQLSHREEKENACEIAMSMCTMEKKSWACVEFFPGAVDPKEKGDKNWIKDSVPILFAGESGFGLLPNERCNSGSIIMIGKAEGIIVSMCVYKDYVGVVQTDGRVIVYQFNFETQKLEQKGSDRRISSSPQDRQSNMRIQISLRDCVEETSAYMGVVVPVPEHEKVTLGGLAKLPVTLTLTTSSHGKHEYCWSSRSARASDKFVEYRDSWKEKASDMVGSTFASVYYRPLKIDNPIEVNGENITLMVDCLCVRTLRSMERLSFTYLTDETGNHFSFTSCVHITKDEREIYVGNNFEDIIFAYEFVLQDDEEYDDKLDGHSPPFYNIKKHKCQKYVFQRKGIIYTELGPTTEICSSSNLVAFLNDGGHVHVFDRKTLKSLRTIDVTDPFGEIDDLFETTTTTSCGGTIKTETTTKRRKYQSIDPLLVGKKKLARTPHGYYCPTQHLRIDNNRLIYFDSHKNIFKSWTFGPTEPFIEESQFEVVVVADE